MESQLFLHTPGGSAHLPTAGRPMVASLSEAKPLFFLGGGGTWYWPKGRPSVGVWPSNRNTRQRSMAKGWRSSHLLQGSQCQYLGKW